MKSAIGLGALALGGACLLLLSLPGRRAAVPSGVGTVPRWLPPPYPEPSTLPPGDDSDLLNLPETPGANDLLWERFAKDPKRPGAALSPEQLGESTPISRGLTAFERWALAPYFPVSEDLDHVLHNGERPPFPDDVDVPPELVAITMQKAGKDPFADALDPEVWFPNAVRPLWQLWWLAVLAHELTHASQIRIGLTIEQGREALRKYGYHDSPIERQARWNQRRVLNALSARARAFYRLA